MSQPKPKPKPRPKPRLKVFDLENDEAIVIDGFDDLIIGTEVFVFTNPDTWETDPIEDGTWTLENGTQIDTANGVIA